MAFLIVSSGTRASSTLRTVRTGAFVAAAVAVVLASVAGGLALGLKFGNSAMTASVDGAIGPENPALIDRIGALSGRLIRLESEALLLSKRVGLAPAAESAQALGKAAGPASAAADPSGGPFLPPLPATPVAQVSLDLERLGLAARRIESRLALVARAANVEDLDNMAFPSRRPIAGGRISSGFGNRRDPFTNRLARHTGVDMPAPHGAPVLASAGGRVRFAGSRGAYGRTVEIDHGNGLVTRYSHTSKLLVNRGDVVLPGQPIAAVGSTGRSTGPHLHFEVLSDGTPVRPDLYLGRPGS